MAKKISRRDFLKGTAIGGGALLIPTKGFALGSKSIKWYGKVKTVHTFCEMCFWKCGVIAKVKNGRVIKLEGNPEHPQNHGKLCARGNSGIMLLYDPDRLKYPLIRVGKRGEGRFRRASWSEALDYIAQKMQEIKEKYGPHSMAFFTHGAGGGNFRYLMKAYGSRNNAAPSFGQCKGARDVGYELTFGMSPANERADFENAKVILLIGGHIGENIHTGYVRSFANGISKGAKLIVVDPRYSMAASKSDYWLPIKPGTDLALLLSWINVIVNEELYDSEYVETMTVGFDKLKDYIQPYTPEWAEKITEIPADLIYKTARLMGENIPAVAINPGRHTAWYGDDVQRSRALAILTALLGAWGRKGGIFLPVKWRIPRIKHPRYPKPSAPRADGAGTKYPFASKGEGLTVQLRDATLNEDPYPIKGWFVYAQNIVKSFPGMEKTIKAIDKLDLMVVVEVLPTESVLYADVVLPEATYLERYDDLVSLPAKEKFVALRQPVVDPLYESRPGWWIVKELGKRLGLDAYFPYENYEDYLRSRATMAGIDFEELKRKGVVKKPANPYFPEDLSTEGWKIRTPSGKFELYSSELEEAGFDPLPKFTPHGDPPKGYFRLIYGRSPYHTFSRTQNNKWLMELQDTNPVWINSEVAKELGIKDGDRVRLVNQDGVKSNIGVAKVTQGIRKDCVYIVHGFGHKSPFLHLAYNKGISDNHLMTKYTTDPISGTQGLRVNFVKIEKVR